MIPTDEAVVTWEQIEQLTGYSRRTLVRLVREEGLPIRQVAGKMVLLRSEWIRWLKSQPTKN